MICPRCKEGNIVKVRIKKNFQEVFICDEEEDIWFNEKEINHMPTQDFGAYLESLGLKPLWSEVDIID